MGVHHHNIKIEGGIIHKGDFVVVKVFLKYCEFFNKIEDGFSFHIIIVKLFVKKKNFERQKVGKAFGNNT
jgi:hypothetical protein